MNENVEASVIILNFNGEHVIETTIDSVLSSKVKFSFEVIVVDNHSQDNSKKVLKKYQDYSNVKLLFLDANYGFAGGNNRGIDIARGDYVVLLNNDCPVESNWLAELVACADRHPNAFSVNSKICLYPRYVDMSLPLLFPANITKVKLAQSNLLSFRSHCQSLDLLYTQDYNRQILNISVPVDINYDKNVSIEIECNFVVDEENKDTVSLDGQLLDVPEFTKLVNKKTHYTIEKHSSKSKFAECKDVVQTYLLEISLSEPTQKQAYRVVQNAGSMVFQDGYGRDIGASVSGTTQMYERDKHQFNEERIVYATCGAAVLYRRKFLDQLGGGLDDSFFMYYEDTALSEQANLAGFKNYYCPKARVNHLHALSSGEWSDFFIFHVEKGRLLHVFYTFPINVFWREFLAFAIRACGRSVKNIIKRRQCSADTQYFKVIWDFVRNYAKYRNNKKMRYNFEKAAITENYKKILSGYWYFN